MDDSFLLCSPAAAVDLYLEPSVGSATRKTRKASTMAAGATGPVAGEEGDLMRQEGLITKPRCPLESSDYVRYVPNADLALRAPCRTARLVMLSASEASQRVPAVLFASRRLYEFLALHAQVGHEVSDHRHPQAKPEFQPGGGPQQFGGDISEQESPDKRLLLEEVTYAQPAQGKASGQEE